VARQEAIVLKRIPDVPQSIDALAAVGTVTGEDYEQTIEPLIDEARRSDRPLRLLLQIGPEYEGYTAGVVWEKTATAFLAPPLAAFRRLRARDRSPMAFFLPFPLRVFNDDQREEAIAWLRSLPEGPAVSHRLVPESGVLVVEVTAPLRVQDFDALAATADTWLETHEVLPGIVVHAHQFPGWENVAGMLRHLRFARDHHRKVRRVALAADSKLAGLAPRSRLLAMTSSTRPSNGPPVRRSFTPLRRRMTYPRLLNAEGAGFRARCVPR
jgi:SpoIIAA-like